MGVHRGPRFQGESGWGVENVRAACVLCATGHDARADVWALGLIALEVATRRIPFHHVKEVVLTGNLGRPEAVNPPLFLPDDCPGFFLTRRIAVSVCAHHVYSSNARAHSTVV